MIQPYSTNQIMPNGQLISLPLKNNSWMANISAFTAEIKGVRKDLIKQCLAGLWHISSVMGNNMIHDPEKTTCHSTIQLRSTHLWLLQDPWKSIKCPESIVFEFSLTVWTNHQCCCSNPCHGPKAFSFAGKVFAFTSKILMCCSSESSFPLGDILSFGLLSPKNHP